ncbi:MAG: sulfatase-like hydrolase/transferase [Sedimentisphaerales bacterium]|nr:sulfatase-like hydrolase/transferase [Sedimentisphaerales bacterium]
MKNMNRRAFLQRTAAGLGAAALAGTSLGADPVLPDGNPPPRPNILWISCEDISPDLGCYGSDYIHTPVLDQLAAQGTRYTRAFAHAGVCAPARSGIITGMYPSSIGSCPMRCQAVPPDEVKCFTEYLRARGYYCTNNVKTDYQFDAPASSWDQNSNRADWRGRPDADQPFFAVINFTSTHESQIRTPPGKQAQAHDPARAQLPPYYPDTPLVRNDWACYHDNIALRLEKQVAQVLAKLEEDRLADDTIVWFWGDHGRGLPRAKRWLYDSGIHVPLIIRVPEKLRRWAHPADPAALAAGGTCDDLVAFVDFAPTMLSLAGIPVPAHMQGQAFLGPQKAPPRQYIYGARDRMDEANDLIRMVRDQRYKYIRNFMAHVSYGQDIEYMHLMPTMQEMRRLHAEGKLQGPQRLYFREHKPLEELYDTIDDPHEVVNLADDPRQRTVLLRLRQECLQWMRRIQDVGLIPEPDFDALKRPQDSYQTTPEPWFEPEPNNAAPIKVAIHCPEAAASIVYRLDGRTEKFGWRLYTGPVAVSPDQELTAKACRLGAKDSRIVSYRRGDRSRPPAETAPRRPHWKQQLADTDLLERLLAIRELDFEPDKAIPRYFEALADPYGPVRYWAVVGLFIHCSGADHPDRTRALRECSRLLADDSWSVRAAAARALCEWGRADKGLPVLVEALQGANGSGRHYAAVALGRIGPAARPALAAIQASLKDSNGYVARVSRNTLQRLQKEG